MILPSYLVSEDVRAAYPNYCQRKGVLVSQIVELILGKGRLQVVEGGGKIHRAEVARWGRVGGGFGHDNDRSGSLIRWIRESSGEEIEARKEKELTQRARRTQSSQRRKDGKERGAPVAAGAPTKENLGAVRRVSAGRLARRKPRRCRWRRR